MSPEGWSKEVSFFSEAAIHCLYIWTYVLEDFILLGISPAPLYFIKTSSSRKKR